jgi:hypothetical protein
VELQISMVTLVSLGVYWLSCPLLYPVTTVWERRVYLVEKKKKKKNQATSLLGNVTWVGKKSCFHTTVNSCAFAVYLLGFCWLSFGLAQEWYSSAVVVANDFVRLWLQGALFSVFVYLKRLWLLPRPKVFVETATW